MHSTGIEGKLGGTCEESGVHDQEPKARNARTKRSHVQRIPASTKEHVLIHKVASIASARMDLKEKHVRVR
ncbi:hypothetical protein TELCIR_06136 [Teladorsagia circumcincta]|uniref:Uncharacterized protein n=1 Tax=Teladorsagia circumcincta TaxID=45464 RepID=A0A2G9UP68_TELCI|nr:hypothetical protein TELCIR_06136 [Teladorsagia circumcincta]